MNDDYLWNGTGEPDPEIAELERLLAPLRHHRPLELPEAGPRARPKRARVRVVLLTAAAVVALAAAAGVFFSIARPVASWEVARLEGSPRLASRPMGAMGRLRVGQWLETDNGARARIRVGEIGQVEVEPGTRVRLLRAAPQDHRLSLARGALRVTVDAPPRLFFVETPSAVAVDLGCAYRLEVDERGGGWLRVTKGWVALERERRETIVPAGAACALRPDRGPGLPYFEDAPPELVVALRRVDDGDAAALESLLAWSRPRDTLTLWHLLARSEATERDRVYLRMADLRPPPAGVTREGIRALHPGMLEAWRSRLEADWTLPGAVPFRQQKFQKKARTG
jgi:FecR protein